MKHLLTGAIGVVLGLVAGLSLALWGILDSNDTVSEAPGQAQLEVDRVTAERAWYRWYFGEYAAAMRLVQYGQPTGDINRLLHAHSDEFIPIEEVIVGRVCPAETQGAYGGDYIYFGARVMPLPHNDSLDLYAMSYLGAAEFAHNNKVFDALLTSSDLEANRTNLSQPFGLADDWLAEHSWKDLGFGTRNGYGYVTVMSHNSGDMDDDGRADFVLDDWLVLSGRGYGRAASAPRRSMFLGDTLIAVEDNHLTRYRWTVEGLERTAMTELHAPAHPNVPFVVLPLPADRIAVRTSDGMDIYVAGDGRLEYFATVTGLAPGEVQTGAFGDFTGDGDTDAWLAQVATPTPYPGKQDQIVLLRVADIEPGVNDLSEIAWFTVRGSARYSDYDGIGTTLSPVAGDLTGDGNPDLSFTGHRHMNESGALYILRGDGLQRGGTLDITHPDIIRILGNPMSQLAPPYHHWDATDLTGDGHDDLVMPADNDLCAGLNAGAIYTLSGAKIAAAWQRRDAAPAD